MVDIILCVVVQRMRCLECFARSCTMVYCTPSHTHSLSHLHRALGFPFGLAIHILQAFYLAAQYPTTPLLAAALAGLANLAGDLLLVNGMGMGVVGAAAATVAAQALTAAMLFHSLTRGPQPGPSLVQGWTVGVRWRLPSAGAFWKLCCYAGPVGGVLLAKTATYGGDAGAPFFFGSLVLVGAQGDLVDGSWVCDAQLHISTHIKRGIVSQQHPQVY